MKIGKNRAREYLRILASLCLLFALGCTKSTTGDGGVDGSSMNDGSPDGAAVDDGSVIDGDVMDASDTGPVGCAENDTRTMPCPPCGSRLDTCDANGVWALGECVQSGQCIPGEVDTRIGWIVGEPGCGRDDRVCSASCTWGDWTTVRPGYPVNGGFDYSSQGGGSGDLCADRTRRSSGKDPNTCEPLTGRDNPDGGAPLCNRGCPGAPRDNGDETEREICVPAGRVAWGTQSQHTVVGVAAYYIDRHIVSYQRYTRCVDAGGCTPLTPKVYKGHTLVDDPTLTPFGPSVDFLIITATEAQARAFCTWDGGRELPSGIQWERAFKSRSFPEEWEWPRRNLGSEFACSTPFPGCIPGGGNPSFSEGRLYRRIGDAAAARSWVWGVDDMFHFFEYTRSWYPDPPYAYPGPTTNFKPEYPPFGRRRQMRSMSEQEPVEDPNVGISRITPDIGFGAFRCSRWAF